MTSGYNKYYNYYDNSVYQLHTLFIELPPGNGK